MTSTSLVSGAMLGGAMLTGAISIDVVRDHRARLGRPRAVGRGDFDVVEQDLVVRNDRRGSRRVGVAALRVEGHEFSRPFQELVEGDRLLHVVVGSTAQPTVVVERLFRRIAAEDQHRNGLKPGVPLELVADRKTVRARQLDRQHNQVRSVACGRLQTLRRVLDDGHVAPQTRETAAQLAREARVALENQDLLRHFVEA